MYDENTLSDYIVAYLASAGTRSTRKYFEILRERSIARRKKTVVQNTLYRLKKNGIVERSEEGWHLTKRGRDLAEQKERFGFIASPFKKGEPDRLIVIFDVPEDTRRERDWLREQLRSFGYRMIQRSVWIGPGPLPPAFKKRVDDLKIRTCIKTYKIA